MILGLFKVWFLKKLTSPIFQYLMIGLFLFAAYKSHLIFERRDAVKEAQHQSKTIDEAQNKTIKAVDAELKAQYEREIAAAKQDMEKKIAEIKNLAAHDCLDRPLADFRMQLR